MRVVARDEIPAQVDAGRPCDPGRSGVDDRDASSGSRRGPRHHRRANIVTKIRPIADVSDARRAPRPAGPEPDRALHHEPRPAPGPRSVIPARLSNDVRPRPVILGSSPIGAKLTTDPPWHSPLHRHPRARPGDQSTFDVVKMIPGSGPRMTVREHLDRESNLPRAGIIPTRRKIDVRLSQIRHGPPPT
jgi:hypothetical protein